MAIKIAGTDVIDNNRYATNIEGVELSAIAKDIADTAVDVFVYDTRKDSDGGAWRKRCQHTSWYNETLNTATRGSRKEFPAVAVIVAESNQVTIYDGDDPDMPMWMVFNRSGTVGANANIFQYQNNRPIYSVTASNGNVLLGGSFLASVRFISDDAHLWADASGLWRYKGGIEQRNDGLAYSTLNTGNYIVNSSVNDVAMTVLPNAPIDDATGLPIPTIAVATNGGVSVIKDDGSVVDITSYSAAPINIRFSSDNQILVNGRYPNWFEVHSIPTADASVYGYQKQYTVSSTPAIDGGTSASTEKILAIASTDYGYGVGIQSHNLNLIMSEQTQASESIAYITSSYNTGWMNGDIKLATLSDTDDTDVTGSELVTNGTFDSDISGWSASDAGCSLSLVSNQLRITNNDASAGGAVTSFSVVSGKTYTFSVGTSSKAVWLYLGDAPNNAAYFGPVVSNSHTWTSNTTGTVYFMVKNSVTTNGDTIDIDNISVRLAEEDRSVNGNGLQVFGTVTKNPVATGADLVAYSGWSSSNYLLQPHNSDIDDIGTGEFMFMTWIKGTSHFNNIISYEYHDGSSWQQLTRLEGGATEGTVRLRVSSSGSYVTSTSTIHDGSWHLVAGVRRAGGIAEIYVDGKLEASITGQTYSISNDNAGVILGPDYRAHSGASPAVGSGTLALVRISATAPSAEQIAKIYEDEKVLFQENAQATLYGSSDAVTALAYDDDTNLLHVGTSSGRSDFNGLRRVNNTTDAVGAAISASNGLIAED